MYNGALWNAIHYAAIGGYFIDNPIASLHRDGGIPIQTFRRLLPRFRAVGRCANADQRIWHLEIPKTLHRSDFADAARHLANRLFTAIRSRWRMPHVTTSALGRRLSTSLRAVPPQCAARRRARWCRTSRWLPPSSKLSSRRTYLLPQNLFGPGNDDHKTPLAVARIGRRLRHCRPAVHGRTRTQMYKGEAAYDLIAETKCRPNIPGLVNGDITSPQKAAAVFKQTAADGIMIGAALKADRGSSAIWNITPNTVFYRLPWVCRMRRHFELPSAPCTFYGETAYAHCTQTQAGNIGEPGRRTGAREINRLTVAAQYDMLAGYLKAPAGNSTVGRAATAQMLWTLLIISWKCNHASYLLFWYFPMYQTKFGTIFQHLNGTGTLRRVRYGIASGGAAAGVDTMRRQPVQSPSCWDWTAILCKNRFNTVCQNMSATVRAQVSTWQPRNGFRHHRCQGRDHFYVASGCIKRSPGCACRVGLPWL